MLQLQARGERALGLCWEIEDADGAVVAGKDAFTFLIHDLEHAERFWQGPELHQLQRQFFARLEQQLEQGQAPFSLAEKAAWPASFNYLISDMNGHPAFLEKYWQHHLAAGHWPSAPALISVLSPVETAAGT